MVDEIESGTSVGTEIGNGASEGAAQTPDTPQTAPEAVGDQAQPTGESQAPAYAPNYKFKSFDYEGEIPEKFRSLIKDAESEKEVRDIFTRAYGVDTIKTRHQELKKNFESVNSNFTSLNSQIEAARSDYKRGDLDAFFDKLAIPKQQILQYALKTLQYNELPPDQKAALDARTQAERQAYNLERQNQALAEQYQTQAAQTKRLELEYTAGRPDLAPVISQFDAQVGKPGAFLEAVINHGELTWHRSGGKVDLPVAQAVKEVMQIYGLGQAKAPAPQNAGASAGQIPVKPAPKTIPNIGGQSSTPVKSKGPRSIDDLKKLAAQMN